MELLFREYDDFDTVMPNNEERRPRQVPEWSRRDHEMEHGGHPRQAIRDRRCEAYLVEPRADRGQATYQQPSFQNVEQRWEPAGYQGNRGMGQRPSRSTDSEDQRVYHPTQQQATKKEYRGEDETWREFRLRTGVERPPKHIRDLERRRQEQQAAAAEGHRQGHERRIKAEKRAAQEAVHKKKIEEAEALWEERQTREKARKEEKKAQEKAELESALEIARSFAEQVGSEAAVRWGLQLNAALTANLLWCIRCHKRGHLEDDCPERE